jgi:hypothetical protein
MSRRLSSFVCLLCLLFFVAHPGWSQQQSAPARMSFTIGAGYDQGDFGTTEISRAVYFPFAFRYTADRYEIGVSSSVARLSAPGGVRLIDGVPTRVGPEGLVLRETGAGDTVFLARLFLQEDRGPGTSAPSITPFFRLKIPTASDEKGLGTGRVDYGFGVEVDKDLGSAFVFGDLGYTVVGQVPRLNLRNRPLASIGVGKQLSDALSVSSMLDWRRSIVVGNPDPTDLVGIVTYRVGTTTISPNAFVGLTDGSPDVGAGIQVRFRFGQ